MQNHHSNVRLATLNDISLITHLTRQAWEHMAPPASSGHHETEERVREDLERGGGLVLEVAGVPVGSVRWYPDRVANAWEVMRLGIVSGFRSQGWGVYLIDEVARLARTSGVPELRIFIEVGQPTLVAWYEQQGFFVDETPEYALQGAETPLIMLRKVLQAETQAHHRQA
jgi:GNAT superfamily N-acetyltransferase